MAKKNEWKNREGVVYSTNQNFQFSTSSELKKTLTPQQQNLNVLLDKSGRAGKQVTLITCFIGTTSDIEVLTKLLKTKCGVGGSAKEGEILIQGDVRMKVVDILTKERYKVKQIE